MRIYLDSCCLNRLPDDQSQPRVQSECIAIAYVFAQAQRGVLAVLSSEVLLAEIRANRDEVRREQALSLLSSASDFIWTDEAAAHRAGRLVKDGYSPFDALHIASAELGSADFLLTTDDRLVRMAARGVGTPRVRLLNPVSWKQELRL